RLVYQWRPDVVHSHMVHANLITRLARLAAPMPRLVCTAHSNREGGRLVMWAYRLTNGLADVTTHVSEEAAREYEQAGAVPPGGILTVYNGINVQRFADKSGANARGCGQLQPGRRLVLSVGRLVPEKNQAALLRAFALIEVGIVIRISGSWAKAPCERTSKLSARSWAWMGGSAWSGNAMMC